MAKELYEKLNLIKVIFSPCWDSKFILFSFNYSCYSRSLLFLNCCSAYCWYLCQFPLPFLGTLSTGMSLAMLHWKGAMGTAGLFASFLWLFLCCPHLLTIIFCFHWEQSLLIYADGMIFWLSALFSLCCAYFDSLIHSKPIFFPLAAHSHFFEFFCHYFFLLYVLSAYSSSGLLV